MICIYYTSKSYCIVVPVTTSVRLESDLPQVRGLDRNHGYPLICESAPLLMQGTVLEVIILAQIFSIPHAGLESHTGDVLDHVTGHTFGDTHNHVLGSCSQALHQRPHPCVERETQPGMVEIAKNTCSSCSFRCLGQIGSTCTLIFTFFTITQPSRSNVSEPGHAIS